MRGPSQARRERDPRTTGQKPGNKKNCTRAGRVGEGGARSAVTQSEEIMEEIYQIQRGPAAARAPPMARAPDAARRADRGPEHRTHTVGPRRVT